jgi:hypothetical protein
MSFVLASSHATSLSMIVHVEDSRAKAIAYSSCAIRLSLITSRQ